MNPEVLLAKEFYKQYVKYESGKPITQGSEPFDVLPERIRILTIASMLAMLEEGTIMAGPHLET